MSSIKTQAAVSKTKFGVNQHDKVLPKQQSLGLKLKNIFPNEEIMKEYSALHYRTYFTFKKHMLVAEIDEKWHDGRYPDYEKKRQKRTRKFDYHLIRINHDKMDFNDYEEFGRVSAYIIKSTKKQIYKST